MTDATPEELAAFEKEISKLSAYDLKYMLAAGYTGARYNIIMRRYLEAKKQQQRRGE